jgi:hypothetical protein
VPDNVLHHVCDSGGRRAITGPMLPQQITLPTHSDLIRANSDEARWRWPTAHDDRAVVSDQGWGLSRSPGSPRSTSDGGGGKRRSARSVDRDMLGRSHRTGRQGVCQGQSQPGAMRRCWMRSGNRRTRQSAKHWQAGTACHQHPPNTLTSGTRVYARQQCGDEHESGYQCACQADQQHAAHAGGARVRRQRERPEGRAGGER